VKSIFIESVAKTRLKECVDKANKAWEGLCGKSDKKSLFDQEQAVIALLKTREWKEGSQGQKEGKVQETNEQTGGAGQQGGRGFWGGGGGLGGGFFVGGGEG